MYDAPASATRVRNEPPIATAVSVSGPHVRGRSPAESDSAVPEAPAELAEILLRLGPVADRLGSRAVIAQYEADIDDPARTCRGTSLAGTRGALPRFLPVRDILRINFNMHAIVPSEVVPRRLARSARMPTDDNLSTTVPYAPTLRAALDLVARYGEAVVPWYRRRLEPDGDELRICYDPIVPLGRIEPLATEIALATIHRIVELFAGERITGARVEFRQVPVSDAATLAERFSCDIAVGAAESCMIIPAAWAELPSPYHDATLWREGWVRCEADIRALEDSPLASKARAHVQRCLDDGRMTTVAETARALGTSSRSLVRALARGATTHHRIVDAVRRERALQLLAQPGVSLADIAERLDFPDQSSFGRKSRAWFGESPARLRRQMSANRSR